jgi:hypothetical protein
MFQNQCIMYIFMNYITMMITWCVVTMLRVWGRKGRDGGVSCGSPPYSKQGHCFCVIIVKKLDPLQSSPPHYQTVTIIHRVLWYSVRFSFRSTVQMAGGIWVTGWLKNYKTFLFYFFIKNDIILKKILKLTQLYLI